MKFKLLDPTNDAVFKILLTRYEVLLRDMIESVLELQSPIKELVVANPEVPKDYPADKGIVLDVLVRLGDGTQVNLEMQSTTTPEVRVRFLYYWAKAFSERLGVGEDYRELRPCISILWFKVPVMTSERFHSTFHLAEDHSGDIFTPEIEFHVLEISKLAFAKTVKEAKLEQWARFLRARTLKELEVLANEEPVMAIAKQALEEVSSDPKAQVVARERDLAVWNMQHMLHASRKEGREEGRKEALEFLIRTIERFCASTHIEFEPSKLNELRALDLTQLDRFMDVLVTTGKWPEGF